MLQYPKVLLKPFLHQPMLFKKKQTPFSWEKTFIVIGSVFLVAFIGGMFTDIGPWYEQLPKIGLQPPKWIFGPVWTILFILIGLAALLVWNAKKADEKLKNAAMFCFLANGILNVLWSFLFFTLKDISKSFTEILVLWISIALMILLSAKIDKKAAWLLVPYLVWVSFASYLTYSFWIGTI